jgi:hypothetical protein
MVDDSLFSRMRALVSWAGPNNGAVPEDETAPAEQGAVYSRSGESFSIPDAWLKQLAVNDDTILAREGNRDLKLYEALLDDDVAFSCFQQRRLAVVSKDWEVEPGDENDPRSVEAAEHLRQQLKQVGFDRACNLMLFSVWFGYSVAEFVWKVGPDGKIWISDIIVPDRRWFGFTNGGELRFNPTISVMGGETVPPNKFWLCRNGASHDFAFYGIGLGHWAYWPVWFKRQVIRFWAVYLEKLGFPTVVGGQESNWTETEKTDFLKTLVAIGRDRAVRVPSEVYDKIQLLEAQRSGAGTSSYSDFVTEQNEALMRVILGQTSTTKATPQGLNGRGAEVHQDVKEEIVKADSDLLSESFPAAKWLTRWNFGEDVAPPRVYRKLEKEEDLDTVAERDVKLDGIGIKRTKASVADVYGAGYELDDREPVDHPSGKTGQLPTSANDDEKDDREAERAAFAARDVAPLYVYRKLVNARALLAWAKAQGIPNLVPAKELHVTCLYSKRPVDWFDLAGGWSWEGGVKVAAGGPRKVELLGDENSALVLRFASSELEWQHREKIEKGASHDYPEYLPHVTLSYDASGFDLDSVEPYNGELIFGPEIFEDIDPEFGALVDALVFEAGEEDAIEKIARALAEETNPILLEFGAALAESVKGVKSAEGLRVALLEAFERLPASRLAQAAGLPLLSERMRAEAGVD